MDPERDMKADFRLSRQAFTGLLTILSQERDHGWGHHLEALIFVLWLAHGVSYRVTAQAFDVPKTTVFRVVHTTTMQGPRSSSAIDGCHIRIKPPSRNKACYYNYKGYYSIQMQAICDSMGRFMDIFVGYAGSAHNTRVLRNSPVYFRSLYPPPSYFLVGDGGYPCIEQPIAIVTPFRRPLPGVMEERFNKVHGRARSIIKRSFGLMKAWWQATLFKALEVRPHFVSEVPLACSFLHNICLAHGDVMEEEELEPEDPGLPAPADHHHMEESSGDHIRARLCTQVSAPQ
ncbi:hypothetical protein ABVT39_019127 [Epinephelus coioides]